ncbi:uncharacterized protein [Physcomitrium patens]|uniref:uncharacterized protein isoform X5 n=1 Tax=Physcomitrium patens TaxID=3218 RepID=UPI000D170EE5|nr:uncharacterized protein LOC112278771 isoform X2 [Physcomitrium patens]|eukprot:XP_024368283.1 uncharacterized protein LOC112278771 isoform X2 [Physcomitrella patens]
MWNLLHFSSFGGYTNEISLRQPSTSDCGDSVCSHHKMSCKPTSSFGAKGPLLQASIVEISYRLSRQDPELICSIKDETYKCALQSLLKVRRPNLLPEIRNLVMLVNNNTRQFRSVYSLESEWVKINGQNVTTAEERWVDFGKTHFSFHALSKTGSAQGAAAPDMLVPCQEYSCSEIFDILYIDVVGVRESTPKQLEITVNGQTSLQTSVNEQALQIKRTLIQFSFAEEDILLLGKHVLPRILPMRTKAANIKPCKTSQDISKGCIIRKSSQGIIIPTHASKDDVRAQTEPSVHLPCVTNCMKPASCSNEVPPKNALEGENDEPRASNLHPEQTSTVDWETRVDENPTKKLSSCAQIIEEALSLSLFNRISPDLQCEDVKETSVELATNIKGPAEFISMNSGDILSAAELLREEIPFRISPSKKVNVQLKGAGPSGTLDVCQHRRLRMKPSCNPRQGSEVGKFQSQNQAVPVVPQKGAYLRRRKRNIVTSTVDVKYYQEEKKPRNLVKNNGNHHSSGGSGSEIGLECEEKKSKSFSRLTNNHHESNIEKLDGRDAVSVQKLDEAVISNVTQLGCKRLHRLTMHSHSVESAQKGNSVTLCLPTVRNQTNTRSEFSFSEATLGLDSRGDNRKRRRSETEAVVIGPEREQFVLDSCTSIRRADLSIVKRQIGRPRKVDTRALNHQAMADTKSHQVYSNPSPEVHLDQQLDAAVANDIQKMNPKLARNSNTTTREQDLMASAEKVQTVKRPRGRPRKVLDSTGMSHQALPDRKHDTVCSPPTLKVALDLQSHRAVLDRDKQGIKMSPDASEKREIFPAVSLREENPAGEIHVVEQSKASSDEVIRTTLSSENMRMFQRSGTECGKRAALSTSGGTLKLKENEKVCSKFESPVMSKGPALPSTGNPDIHVLESSDQRKGLSSQRNTLTSSNTSTRQNEEVTIDHSYIHSNILPDDGKAHVHAPKLVHVDQADVKNDSPLVDKTHTSDSYDEGDRPIKILQVEPPDDKNLSPITMRGSGLVSSEAKVHDPCAITPLVDAEEFESPVAARAYKPRDGSETIEKSQLLRDDGLGSSICTPNLNKNNPSAKVVAKEKSPSYSLERLPEKNAGNKSKETHLLTKVTENFDLKNECKAAEMEKDVDLYYSTPVSAARKRRIAEHSPPDLSSSSGSSCGMAYKGKAGRKRRTFADRDSVSESEDWERVFMSNARSRSGMISCPGNGNKIKIADSVSHAHDKLLPRGDLPKSRNQPSKRSKGPKVKFTIPLAAQHNDGDGMNCVSRGKPDPMFSSELFTSMMSKVAAGSDSENEDEDGLTRSVKMVEKMLESFRRKVEVQVKEKTNQVLDNVLQDLKSEVDSFNSQVQQDLDDFVNICTRKFEKLEAKRHAHLEKGRIWQEKIAQELKIHVQESKDLFCDVKITEAELKAMAEKRRSGQKSTLCQLQEKFQQNVENAGKKICAIKKNAEQLHGLRDILKGWV